MRNENIDELHYISSVVVNYTLHNFLLGREGYRSSERVKHSRGVVVCFPLNESSGFVVLVAEMLLHVEVNLALLWLYSFIPSYTCSERSVSWHPSNFFVELVKWLLPHPNDYLFVFAVNTKYKRLIAISDLQGNTTHIHVPF